MNGKIVVKSLIALSVMTSLVITTNGVSDLKHSDLIAKAEEKNEVQPKIEEVKNSFHAPYNIVTKIKTPNSYATGFVSGKTTVMTNRHVLKSILKEGTLKTDVILAKNDANEGDKKDLGTFKIKDFTVAPDNIDVVILEMHPNENGKYIGDIVQPAKIKSADNITQEWIDNNKDKKFFIAGYPGNKDKNKMWHAEGKLKFFIGGNDPLKFYGDIPAAPGNSGSPVFNANNEVVGIVYSGWDSGTDVNGYMFRENLYKFIEANT